QKHRQAAEVLEELRALVNDVFKANPRIETFFTSPAVGRDPKTQVLERILQSRVSETLANFLFVLNHHDRLDLLRPILAAYSELYDQRAGRMNVQVSTAAPLPDDQREQLSRKLKEAFQREPVLNVSVEPDLLGGMIV